MISGGKAPFTYTWNNGSHASALSGLHGGGYAVTITDANGCVITDTFNLVEKQFILDVTADQTEIELGEEVHFNSNITGGTGMESITWNPGIFLSCDTCKNPTAGPMKSVKYNIVAVDTNGCSSTDTISIQVTPKYDLFVPNAFSPNNDGSNDVYEIFGNKKIWAEVEFKIFNRWGELIFESRDHEFKWDGTFKGEMLTPQVVVYEFKVVYVDGYSAPTQKGSITIIR
jgi:gliding motility-associated-like protein